jgi:hypothetical protein
MVIQTMPPLFGAHPFAQAALSTELVEAADNAAGVAAQFIVVFFEFIQLFDHGHRQDNGVVGERGDGLAVMKKDVGIKNKVFVGHAAPGGVNGR